MKNEKIKVENQECVPTNEDRFARIVANIKLVLGELADFVPVLLSVINVFRKK